MILKILQESFLEDINNILNNDKFSSLFKDNEMRVIFNNLKDKVKDNEYQKTKDRIYQGFEAIISDSIQVALSFSSVNLLFNYRYI